MTARGQELTIPAEFAGLVETPIMPSEDRQQFEALRWMIVDEVRPKTPLQWLLCLDLVEQSWEILRYRRLKQKILPPDVRSESESFLSGSMARVWKIRRELTLKAHGALRLGVMTQPLQSKSRDVSGLRATTHKRSMQKCSFSPMPHFYCLIG